jgi:group I intron endonuclease
MGCVYLATNTETNDQYIGYTIKTLKDRIKRHYKNARLGYDSTLHFIRAIRKYGTNLFSWRILFESNIVVELKEKEIYFIEKYSPAYNMTKGGDGTDGLPYTDERRRKISEAHTGKRRGMFSEEWRNNLGNAHLGIKHPPRSEEWRRKQSESHKGKPLSEEHRRKLSESRMGKKRGPYGPNGPMSEEQRRNISAGLIKFNNAKKQVEAVHE